MRPEELPVDTRRELLRIARDAIVSALGGTPVPEWRANEILKRKSGAFVSLHRRDDGSLRGCVGYVEAVCSLVDVVVRVAVAAATEDSRFEPVTLAELPALTIEISALGALQPIAPDEVEVGRHGLLIRYAGRSGLLLPQVASEHGWDRETFLEHTCLKAGLPRGTWRKPDVQLMGFTATVFGEDDTLDS